MQYGLIGEKLGHSFSREIHEKLNRYEYILKELAPGEVDAFLREKDFAGINVTIPYKQTVIPYLDEITDRAEAIGAVNTIVNRNGKLLGDNTDFGGMEALIRRMGLDLKGKKVLIAGTGGTSKTAKAVADGYGAAEIHKLSRSEKEGCISYEEAYREHADAQILINTTPAGMYPATDGMAVDPGKLPCLEGVVDVVYNPLTTRLVRTAREKGIPAENGLYMLVAQAVLAAEIFTGESFGNDCIESIYRETVFEKRNVVLTGMPSSGKTTLGRLLAKKLGRELVDTDEKIVERAGMPVTEIFRLKGEQAFRDMESEILKEISRSGGKIVATGGGAILRSENVDVLKSNGTVVFLDRDPGQLQPTDDRPLADDGGKIRRLYSERYPKYMAAADLRIVIRGTPENTAEELLEKLK